MKLPHSSNPKVYAYISLATAFLTMGLKTVAWLKTDSVGLLSDAVESIVNVFGATIALWAVTLAAQPPDRKHPHGHGKAELMSAAAEGMLVILAAALIVYAAYDRLFNPIEVKELTLGLIWGGVASLFNLLVSLLLKNAGKRLTSPALTADAAHLMSDVWSTIAIAVGLVGGKLLGWPILDPILAIGISLHITWSGMAILKNAFSGLMDEGLDHDELKLIEDYLSTYASKQVFYHALRTRKAGGEVFIGIHLLMPGKWNLQKAHSFADEIEKGIVKLMSNARVITHLEPDDDPASMDDEDFP